MIIIGELINASRKAIKAAGDAAAIQKVAGRDNFCMNDLKAFRAGMFEG